MSNPSSRESRSRSLLKGLTWRFIATATTILIAWWITGDTRVALEIGLIEVFAKIGVYYVHERAWSRIPMGLEVHEQR
ncbi:MAG: DUF2061 domain-containing protein [Gammaproteobacteria bacterium]|nr:DUF2061 domain-containing protein [Gammaproteobacteria bacterium]